MKRIVLLIAGLASAASVLAASPAWPERPVKVIIPFPAGGPADTAMRIVGNRLSEVWKQPVVVENKPGAPGIVSVGAAAPDGYTLLLGAGSGMVTTPLVNPRLAYKPSDFAPVSLLVTSTSILTVNPAFPVKSVKELVAYAKAHPGQVNYSSSGMGSPGHLTMEMFQQLTGTKMTHIPYKGGIPAVAELMAGHVQAGVNATPSVIQHVNAGKLLPLAVTSKHRDKALPNVPTMEEAGVSGLTFDAWYAIFAPKKTPASVVDKASADIGRVLAEPEIQKRIEAQGNMAGGGTPQQLDQMVQSETQAWTNLIRTRKLTIEE